MPMMDSKLYDKVQQPSKSTHIIPTKGTFNVETVDKFSDDETILNSPDRTYVNRSPIDQKEFFSRNNNSDEDVEKIRSEYEYKMSMMQNHIKQLQDKLEVIYLIIVSFYKLTPCFTRKRMIKVWTV